MSFDLSNAVFELLGAVAVWMNVAKLLKSKCVRGVYGWASFFYLAWGLFNLFFYPHLQQWFSFVAGIFIALGNAVWFALYVRYHKN